jgi:hypothetical protein
LRGTKQSLQKIASFLAMTDWERNTGVLPAFAGARNAQRIEKILF